MVLSTNLPAVLAPDDLIITAVRAQEIGCSLLVNGAFFAACTFAYHGLRIAGYFIKLMVGI